MLSALISPLVVVGIFLNQQRLNRLLATIIPLLLMAPWIVFAWPEHGWGAVSLHPLIEHYMWTAGCLLIFTPQYIAMFGRGKVEPAAKE